MEHLIIKNLCKSFGKVKALDNVSLDIKPGMYGLLGPNGAGKTTLMRTLTTLLPIEKGEINFENIIWGNNEHVKKVIGYLPQKFYIYKKLNVEEVLKHIAILKGIDENIIPKEVERVLKQFNMDKEKNKRIVELSGGMVRRVGIAQAMLGNPKLIIVDEPTAGLDPEERIRFRNMLTSLGENAVVIISTHIVEDIETTCDQVGVLNKGKVIYDGSIHGMKHKAKDSVFEVIIPRNDYYEIKGDFNVISTKAEGDNFRVRFLKDGSIIPQGLELYNVDINLEDAYLYMLRNIDD